MKKFIKKSFRLIGLDVRKAVSVTDSAPSPVTDLWLKNIGINTVLDIGANKGQFARNVHITLPEARIISFEPLEDCYNELIKNMADLKDFKAYNVALGNSSGETVINRSEFSPSSSLLEMADLHKRAFPFTKESTTEKIKVERLDNIHDLNITNKLLVKIDVQGYEDKVIEGGKNIIKNADVIIIEVSFRSLYRGQPMFDTIYSMLKDLGFAYHGNTWQTNDPEDGSALQADAVFIKKRDDV